MIKMLSLSTNGIQKWLCIYYTQQTAGNTGLEFRRDILIFVYMKFFSITKCYLPFQWESNCFIIVCIMLQSSQNILRSHIMLITFQTFVINKHEVRKSYYSYLINKYLSINYMPGTVVATKQSTKINPCLHRPYVIGGEPKSNKCNK